ncbi:MAG TPA: hypothetical protein VFF16_02775 [Telluria sp.]|nr:hypothetical protein [Telluria sp.]
MKKLVIWPLLAVLCVALIGVLNTASAFSACDQLGDNGKCSIYRASMIELVVNPEKFDGKTVRIIGYLNLEFEGNVLYPHKEDFVNAILGNGVWVDIDTTPLPKKASCRSRRYAILEGIFSSKNHGHMGAWSGSLERISRCDLWR